MDYMILARFTILIAVGILLLLFIAISKFEISNEVVSTVAIYEQDRNVQNNLGNVSWNLLIKDVVKKAKRLVRTVFLDDLC